MRRSTALFIALLGAPIAMNSVAAQEPGVVYRIPVTGVIELGLAPFIERGIRTAKSAGAAAVILDIDTPGGRVDAAERIADAIAESTIPVYAYVNRRAFSAGALISLATDRIYMLPGSTIGAATPVDGAGTKASEKIVSAMRSEMRALAEAHGVDPAIAEAMVDESLEVPGVIEAGRLLTLTTEEAVELGYALQTDGFEDLLRELGQTDAEVTTMQVNWAERMVRFLSHPVISPFLLSIGFLGLLIEIKTPTLGIAGGAGVLALSLFFGSHLILGLAGWEDLLLVAAGIVFMGIEVFVIPGFGLFGVLGIFGVLGGVFLSLLGSFPTVSEFASATGILSTSILLIMVVAWAVLRHLPKSRHLYRSGVLLGAATDAETGYQSALKRPDMVGKSGVAITDLRPSGVALVEDERLDVVSESEWIEEGTPIEIVSADGYRHLVRPAQRT